MKKILLNTNYHEFTINIYSWAIHGNSRFLERKSTETLTH